MKNINIILELLKTNYPYVKTGLRYKTPFQFLTAVILSARSTDEQVNRITPLLFSKYGNAYEMALATPEEIEELIKKTGLYRAKSRNLIKTAGIIAGKYGGNVPDNMEELLALPGIGRKTANVILSNLYKQPAIAVDTHVYRVSRRLGLSVGKNAYEVEKELTGIIPRSLWSETHHRLIAHGRSLCNARAPRCDICFLKEICSQKGF